MQHGRDGRVVEVAARTRTIPPALRRALHNRDRGCRFPGCGVRFGQGHHIRHWAQGGPTMLSNLAMLCRRHHRAVHEEGYQVDRQRDGELRFRRPDGRLLPEVPRAPEVSGDPAQVLRARHEAEGLVLHARTSMPGWMGSGWMSGGRSTSCTRWRLYPRGQQRCHVRRLGSSQQRRPRYPQWAKPERRSCARAVAQDQDGPTTTAPRQSRRLPSSSRISAAPGSRPPSTCSIQGCGGRRRLGRPTRSGKLPDYRGRAPFVTPGTSEVTRSNFRRHQVWGYSNRSISGIRAEERRTCRRNWKEKWRS